MLFIATFVRYDVRFAFKATQMCINHRATPVHYGDITYPDTFRKHQWKSWGIDRVSKMAMPDKKRVSTYGPRSNIYPGAHPRAKRTPGTELTLP